MTTRRHPVTSDRSHLLTLDLDDTLWPCYPVIRAAEAGMYAWLQAAVPALTARYDLEALRDHRMTLMADELAHLAHDLTAVRREALRRLLDGHADAERLAHAATAEFRRLRNQVEPYPEVPETLARLRRDWVLVALTNGNAQVEETPLAGCFDAVFTAADVGAAKPDAALFEAARGVAGGPLARAVHVGDDPHLDVQAARDAGFEAIWMTREARAWPAELGEVAPRIGRLDELPGLLA